jgi:hypothetical protein
MGLEIANVNEGVVTQRKSLAILLAEKDPDSITRKGTCTIRDHDPGKGPAGRPAASAHAPGPVLLFHG